jgi:ERCC4-type nuclease
MSHGANSNGTEMSVWVAPYTIVTDTREQLPWTFDGLVKFVDGKWVRVEIPITVHSLKTGDYSIAGHEGDLAIERKSKMDLVGTITRGRKRFERELERMREYKVSAVIIESEWLECQKYCECCTEVNPRSLNNTILAWNQRFPTTQWLFRPSRFTAGATAWGIAERFLRDRNLLES